MLHFESFAKSELQKRQRQIWALSPEERLNRYIALQAAADSVRASNPRALDAFHRRNHQQRTESRVREMESQLLRPAVTEATE